MDRNRDNNHLDRNRTLNFKNVNSTSLFKDTVLVVGNILILDNSGTKLMSIQTIVGQN